MYGYETGSHRQVATLKKIGRGAVGLGRGGGSGWNISLCVFIYYLGCGWVSLGSRRVNIEDRHVVPAGSPLRSLSVDPL